MKRIIAAIMVLVFVSVSVLILVRFCDPFDLGCAGLYLMKGRESLDEEKAKTIAQSYLEEKYDEEFIYVSNKVRSRRHEELDVVCGFIRKDDEEVEEPMEYHVDIIFDPYERKVYTVKGDDYMFVYIRKAAEDFLRPYVENRFSNIEFVFFVRRANEQCGAIDGEYYADAKIPRSFDELYDLTSKIYFKIIVPESEDQNKVSEACGLLRRDLEELNIKIEIGGVIDVYQNDDFAEISQSSDPRRDATVAYSREKIM